MNSVMKPDMSVILAGIMLRNPVMTASGTFGYGEEFAQYIDMETIGAFVTKGLSLKARAGNPTPRIVETPGGMLNAIGLQNVGIDAFIAKKVPYLRSVNTPAIANFFGSTVDEYTEMARRLDEIVEVAGLEINISCPNVKQGGIVFGADPGSAASVVSACRAVTKKPLIVKLSPNVTDVVVMARACEDAGADALSLINTLTTASSQTSLMSISASLASAALLSRLATACSRVGSTAMAGGGAMPSSVRRLAALGRIVCQRARRDCSQAPASTS